MNSSFWAVVAGSMFGAAVAYALVDDAKTKALIERGRQFGLPLRLPQPGFAMQLPTSAEEFALLEEQLCACVASYARPSDGDPTLSDADYGAPPTQDELVGHMASCGANHLYPNFPWPPITGDHPSVAELWSDLRILARRALATGACTAPV